MSHTPGPWEWKSGELLASNGVILALGDDDGSSDPECCGVPSYHIEVSEANARLIAAAPELLEALRKLRNEASGFVAFCDPAVHGLVNIGVLRTRIAEAEAIIVKAEGPS